MVRGDITIEPNVILPDLNVLRIPEELSMRKQKPAVTNTVTVEYNGKIHTADYTIESGVVIVQYDLTTNRAIPTSPASHEHEAKRLLLEILQT